MAVMEARNALRCTAIEDFPAIIATAYEPYGPLDIPALIAWSECDRILPYDRYAPNWRRYAPRQPGAPSPAWATSACTTELVAHTVLEWTAQAAASRAAGREHPRISIRP
ncbi:hypothetical protein [Nocardia acidivorans]|uniref:hypothetical protein n=1 Tax=Nocardia acidivorans TaxID=404580 RepID=UPI000829E4C5|nr:hypothetical protein [Nocardia acidivorans]